MFLAVSFYLSSLYAEVSFLYRPLTYSMVSQNSPLPSVCHISPPFPCYAQNTKHCSFWLTLSGLGNFMKETWPAISLKLELTSWVFGNKDYI
jgi:hypothetical protein